MDSQTPSSADQPIAPPAVRVVQDTIQSQAPHRKSKKLIVLAICLLVLLFVIGLGMEALRAMNFNRQISAYKSSSELTVYTDNLKQFMSANNGIGPKLYTCQLTSDLLWHPEKSGGESFDNTMALYSKARGNISINTIAAKDKLPKPYKKGVFSKILPLTSSASSKLQQFNDYVKIGEHLSYANIGTTAEASLTNYCVDTAYESLSATKILEDYSSPNYVIQEKPELLQQRLDYFVKEKQRLADLQGKDVPIEAGPTHASLLIFYEKMRIDLTSLVKARKASPGGVSNMYSSFVSDRKALETSVLNKLTEAGKTIKPSPQDIQNAIDAISKL